MEINDRVRFNGFTLSTHGQEGGHYTDVCIYIYIYIFIRLTLNLIKHKRTLKPAY